MNHIDPIHFSFFLGSVSQPIQRDCPLQNKLLRHVSVLFLCILFRLGFARHSTKSNAVRKRKLNNRTREGKRLHRWRWGPSDPSPRPLSGQRRTVRDLVARGALFRQSYTSFVARAKGRATGRRTQRVCYSLSMSNSLFSSSFFIFFVFLAFTPAFSFSLSVLHPISLFCDTRVCALRNKAHTQYIYMEDKDRHTQRERETCYTLNVLYTDRGNDMKWGSARSSSWDR